MKILHYIAAIGIIVWGGSCKPLKTLTSKDTSSTQPTTIKRTKKEVAFIENIEVTPGSVVTTRHKTINTSKNSNATSKYAGAAKNKTTVDQVPPDTLLTKNSIEDVNTLQIKYAVMLDATIERITNIPLFQTIDHWMGTRYCLGGSTENCIDCSAFMQVLMKEVNQTQLPRTAQEQYNNSDPVELSDLKEGDLVFFDTNGGKKRRHVSHVGYYIMNNKFVHASTSNGVTISDLNESYWKQRYVGAGRVKALHP